MKSFGQYKEQARGQRKQKGLVQEPMTKHSISRWEGKCLIFLWKYRIAFFGERALKTVVYELPI